MSLDFSEASYIEAMRSLVEYVDILAEVSGCVAEFFSATPGLIEDYVTPLESVVEGVRLEIGSVRGDMGVKEMTLSNVPPGLWNAVETGFMSISEVEKQVGSMESEIKQMASFVLENVQPLDAVAANAKTDDDVDDGTKFVKAQFKASIPKTNIIDTRQNNNHRDMDCDTDVSKCSLYMACMDGLE